MSGIGEYPMPEDFRYRETASRGKPRHEKTDAFRLRHPSMDVGRRAKIFAPFDALKGFDEAIGSKDELYETRRDPDEEALAELNRRLGILHALTSGSPASRRQYPEITVTFFVPCTDENSSAFGTGGQYLTRTGTCRGVDPVRTRSLLLDGIRIGFPDILRIDGPAGLFDTDPTR